MSDPRTPYYAEPKKPRLIWNNRDRRKVAAPLPAQTVEVISPFYAQPQGALDMRFEAKPENRLIWTNDNLIALTSLLEGDTTHEPLEGKVDLIYIDPPFAVQSDFKINVEIENGLADEKLPTLIEELAYTDTWKDGLDSYLSMMRDRLELLKRMLAPTGSIFVHCDYHAGHYIKVLMDEVFGYENFVNEIIWKRTFAHNDPGRYGITCDNVFFYAREVTLHKWNQVYQPYEQSYVDSHFNQTDTQGRRFQLVTLDTPGHGRSANYLWKGISPPRGRIWTLTYEKMEELEAWPTSPISPCVSKND